MDFSIVEGDNGIVEMTWDKPTDISTNIYLSLNIKKGSIFNNPDFGLDLSDIKKVTDNNIDLIKERLEKALQWLIGVGKAKSVIVIVEKDLKDIYRINYKIEAIQADGIPIVISNFKRVGGPADGFSI